MAQLDNQGKIHPDANMLFNLAVEEQPSVVSEIMTQLSVKFLLKTCGEKGSKDMKSEMRQLCLCDTCEPRHRYELLSKEKAEIIESRMFLKVKIDGKIKGRSVAGGNKQI